MKTFSSPPAFLSALLLPAVLGTAALATSFSVPAKASPAGAITAADDFDMTPRTRISLNLDDSALQAGFRQGLLQKLNGDELWRREEGHEVMRPFARLRCRSSEAFAGETPTCP